MSCSRSPVDLVVVGAGTAGLPCALEAAERGARVVVIEASNRIGGTLHVSAGHMSAAGTRRQRAAGILDDTPDRHFEDVMAIGGAQGDPALIRLAVDEAPATLDWLEDLGFDYHPDTPAVYYGHTPYSRPRTHWGRRHGLSILHTLEPVWREYVEQGSIVPLMGHRMTDLIVEGGAVKGVWAEAQDGVSEFRARSTVITTGGYGGDAARFEDWTPGSPRLITNSLPSSDGSGIAVARAHGAGFRGADLHTPRLGILELEVGSGRVDFWTAMADLTAVTRPPQEIWVNRSGERFVAEDLSDVTAHEHAVWAQDGQEFWIVFDEAIAHCHPPLVRQWTADELEQHASSATPGPVQRRPDLPSLAAAAGVGVAALVKSVDTYNRAVASGDDPFGRVELNLPIVNPPYYAVRVPAATLCTFGGLTVDSNLEVLSEAGTRIPGLSAAGEAIGMGATSGRAFCGGMAVTPALSFGRLLGQRLG